MKDWKADLAKVILEPQESHLVERGNVYFIPFTESDGLISTQGYDYRDKYCIVVGFTHDGQALGVVLVNHEFRSFLSEKCQYPLSRKDYPVLSKYTTSYVDCTKFMNPINIDRCNENEFRFKLSNNDLELIIENIISNENDIKPREKKQFGLI